ncbi:hypothetical protein FOA52_009263 [Chlamydomonas sp. UWO 241]|nr:hypothetical protein FOA52_009263 [Chlamydomonas sp. UWO 241]
MQRRALAPRVAAPRSPRLGLSRSRGAVTRRVHATAPAAGGSSAQKEEPFAYLRKHHNLAQKLEDAVNACVGATPADPLAFIAAELLRKAPAAITGIVGRQIIDSRGNPTVEAEVTTYKGMFRAAVPSGASTGAHEAVELRDGDASMFLGKGVLRAVDNINSVLAPALMGMNPANQKAIDDCMRALDGTENKGRLGANAILAVSMAVCKAGAAEAGVPLYRHIGALAGNARPVLPVPAFNIINGGSHAGNALAMQEFMILPTGASSFSKAMQMGCEVYHALKGLIKAKYGQDACNVGDEGGFAPSISSSEEGLVLITDAIAQCGYTGKVQIGMDVASSEFFVPSDGTYDLGFKLFILGNSTYDLGFKVQPNDGSQRKSAAQMVELYSGFCDKYDMVSIEDPFEQDDWGPCTELTKLGICQVVGDDILVTNPTRVARAIDAHTCDALLLKVNQIGTISESIDAVRMAKAAGWGVMTSHRSGETEDCFIADLAVGLATGQIKAGAPCRSERLAKYNQLLRIEQELGADAVYAGQSWRCIKWS